MPILARGGGTSLAGQACNAALVLDFSKYMNRLARDRSGRARRPGRARRGAEPSQRRARAAWPVLRARSIDQGSMHHRRDDRQQLMRRAFGRVRQDRRQPRGAGGRALRRHAAVAEARSTRRSSTPHRARRPRRRALLATARASRSLRRWCARISRNFRAASPATTSTSCCPRMASTSRARWWARRARWPRLCARRCGGAAAERSSCWWCSASTTCLSPPIRCRGCWSIAPRRSRASTRSCRSSRASRRCRACAFCPTGARF